MRNHLTATLRQLAILRVVGTGSFFRCFLRMLLLQLLVCGCLISSLDSYLSSPVMKQYKMCMRKLMGMRAPLTIKHTYAWIALALTALALTATVSAHVLTAQVDEVLVTVPTLTLGCG